VFVYRRNAAFVAAAFALLAALVGAGVFHRLDQWAVSHLMPGLEPSPNEPSLADSVVPLLGSDWGDGWSIATNIVALPGAFIISVAIVAWRSRVLAVMLVAAVAVEVICKEVLTKPALYLDCVHIVPFDSSFPSGHALRILLVAGALYPLLRGSVVVWAVAAVTLILLAGWHTPTDIAGGLLLGALGLLCARSAGALRGRRLGRSARA
jgi:membrane-associated phospholipid phosphatase